MVPTIPALSLTQRYFGATWLARVICGMAVLSQSNTLYQEVPGSLHYPHLNTVGCAGFWLIPIETARQFLLVGTFLFPHLSPRVCLFGLSSPELFQMIRVYCETVYRYIAAQSYSRGNGRTVGLLAFISAPGRTDGKVLFALPLPSNPSEQG